jgi:hypothetical protein
LRKSDGFLLVTGGGLLLLIGLLIHGKMVTRAEMPLLRQEVSVARNLGLTDLCLSTEANYTRNPSQADWHTPFQTHPGSLDHFPSGSIIGPPETLRKPHE